MKSLLLKFNKNALFSPPSSTNPIQFGPFNSFIQRRWKKPSNTPQTRLENRTRDLKLDKLTAHIRKLKTALHLFDLMSKRRGPFVSVQIISRWVDVVGLNVSMSDFLGKHSHVFEVFTHPIKKNAVIRESELKHVRRLRKLLMMSKSGTLRVHVLRLVSRELGLPEDFRESILSKYSDDFKLVHLEVVALVERDEDLAVAEVEKWRETEYNERWLSEFGTKYTFPINLPTGFRLPYVKPYGKEGKRSHTSAGIERFDKRVVGIIHEFLSVTVEKLMDVERFAHSRKDLGTKVIDPNLIHVVRRKMLDLMLLGRSCNIKELKSERASGSNRTDIVANKSMDGLRDGEWILPLLKGSDD
ncbi:hypothetical protein Cgig2_017019 [Carnegiea gigantea]|uniref:PORR domain-containing protein n=1 Tax=Carnegiea gigantea TaxID=171969 RepID=A0A9Q1QJ91_9CARY|nr:hypothetical protein Cgig2_017019 [Carnegiea gigantea]